MNPSPAASRTQNPSADAESLQINGEFTLIDGENFYCIRNYDAMDPFFMTIVSDSDHWLFVSSNGCLTAGRKNSQHSLFPYYTEDKIHDMAEVTGPKTICRVEREGGTVLWEPFSDRYRGIHRIKRNLYKSEFGNKVQFEEINLDLGLSFRYMWKFSDEFGFIRESRLENVSRRILKVEVVDGIQNLLPSGVHPDFQLMFSGLGDAYKKSELETGSNLGIFSFSSVPGDKAEPMESLRANTCFGLAPANAVILISSRQLNAFRSGHSPKPETDLRGARGAYFINASFHLEPESREKWSLVADVDKGASDVVNLMQTLSRGNLDAKLEADVRKGTARLKRIVGSADGLQATGDILGANHHFANCLFNVMRGGIFQEGYAIDRQDLLAAIRKFNKNVYASHSAWLEKLPETLALSELERKVAGALDPHLERIVKEYLPLSFSRRHGDPSRPWNIFSIDLKDADGKRILAYQGNWRDIFQNWEALSLSFPEYAESFICKFLNTTTADGYNPYRIGKSGFDWEKPHPNEPWAHIGYWGDHQLIYLLRLMEWSGKFNPGRLEGFLRKEFFVYADVPYDILPYEDLVRDPKHTIEYSKSRERKVDERVSELGMDGQYVRNGQGNIHAVNLAEKLLVPLLAKVSNFIPGAGIWLNTQRPEWNDANNALAGFGLSMVTLYHARRYAAFFKDLLEKSPKGSIALSEEVAIWLQRTVAAMEAFGKDYFEGSGSPETRGLVEPLGKAAADYRKGLYGKSLSGVKTELAMETLTRFLDLTLAYADKAVKANKRNDGLYHSYNVFNPENMEVRTLYEMLEGQVAVLSSGALDLREAISVLEALRASRMYRQDQHSYILYPDKDLPRFVDKNNLPFESLGQHPLFQKLIADGRTSLVEMDVKGDLHFNGDLKNANDLKAVLARLASDGYAHLVGKEKDAIVALFEKVFDHQSFTGRSGTFFGYEGLGSIYWHMISKLLLAVQENYFAAIDAGKAEEAQRLREIYYDVRSGISFNKSPDVYGAFPADPYSHTPAGAGAKQPGMTGQVKEEVITRLGELGVRMRDGKIGFQPVLLRKCEFLDEPAEFEFVNVSGEFEKLLLPPGSLGFTLCQVPVVYHLSDKPQLKITFRDGTAPTGVALELNRETCREIYTRTGKVLKIEVSVPRNTVV
ncbi:MAG: hypothetical protein JWP91_2291 [Fibrobacteres bacterium]|nr:hypothetical protein [Fibrobacterota bacterium]